MRLGRWAKTLALRAGIPGFPTVRVGVNLLAFRPNRIGGLEHYVRRLLDGLRLQSTYTFTLFLPPGVEGSFSEVPDRIRVRPYDLQNGDAGLTEALLEEGVELWWCPWVVWRPLRPPVPAVVTIPDLQHEHLSDSLTPEERQRRRSDYVIAAHCAHAVMTFSEHAGKDLRRQYSVPSDRVFTTPLDVGYDWEETEPSPELLAELRERYGSDFLYYPANTWPHKDHLTLLRALRQLADQGEYHNLLLTGSGDDERDRVERAMGELGLDHSVRLIGTAPPPVVRGLYHLCAAVVFPSRFEGFGMPLLEGMRSGTPVLSSDATSLPEVGGDAVLYFRAGDVQDLAEKIRRITGDESLRTELVQRGYARSAHFSWLETASAVAGVFARARSSGPPDTPFAIALNSVLDTLAASEADRAARLEVIERQQTQLEASEADRAARLEVIQQQQAQLEASETDRAARLEMIERQQAQLEAGEAARLEVIERQRAELEAIEVDRGTRLEVIERLIAGIRDCLGFLERASPKTFHGLAWPWEVLRVDRLISHLRRLLRDLVP